MSRIHTCKFIIRMKVFWNAFREEEFRLIYQTADGFRYNASGEVIKSDYAALEKKRSITAFAQQDLKSLLTEINAPSGLGKTIQVKKDQSISDCLGIMVKGDSFRKLNKTNQDDILRMINVWAAEGNPVNNVWPGDKLSIVQNSDGYYLHIDHKASSRADKDWFLWKAEGIVDENKDDSVNGGGTDKMGGNDVITNITPKFFGSPSMILGASLTFTNTTPNKAKLRHLWRIEGPAPLTTVKFVQGDSGGNLVLAPGYLAGVGEYEIRLESSKLDGTNKKNSIPHILGVLPSGVESLSSSDIEVQLLTYDGNNNFTTDEIISFKDATAAQKIAGYTRVWKIDGTVVAGKSLNLLLQPVFVAGEHSVQLVYKNNETQAETPGAVKSFEVKEVLGSLKKLPVSVNADEIFSNRDISVELYVDTEGNPVINQNNNNYQVNKLSEGVYLIENKVTNEAFQFDGDEITQRNILLESYQSETNKGKRGRFDTYQTATNKEWVYAATIYSGNYQGSVLNEDKRSTLFLNNFEVNGGSFVLTDKKTGTEYPKAINVNKDGNYELIDLPPKIMADFEIQFAKDGQTSAKVGEKIMFKNLTIEKSRLAEMDVPVGRWEIKKPNGDIEFEEPTDAETSDFVESFDVPGTYQIRVTYESNQLEYESSWQTFKVEKAAIITKPRSKTEKKVIISKQEQIFTPPKPDNPNDEFSHWVVDGKIVTDQNKLDGDTLKESFMEGEHTVQPVYKDTNTGKITTGQTETVEAFKSDFVEGSFTKPKTITVGESVTFENTSNNPHNFAHKWEIQQGWNSLHTSDTDNFTHTFPVAGEYSIKLEHYITVDGEGTLIQPVFQTIQVKEKAPEEPLPNFKIDVTTADRNDKYTVGEAITFANKTTVDKKSTYQFDDWFINTKFVSGGDKNTFNHTFTAPGTYTVEVSYVKKGGGLEFGTREIKVEAKEVLKKPIKLDVKLAPDDKKAWKEYPDEVFLDREIDVSLYFDKGVLREGVNNGYQVIKIKNDSYLIEDEGNDQAFIYTNKKNGQGYEITKRYVLLEPFKKDEEGQRGRRATFRRQGETANPTVQIYSGSLEGAEIRLDVLQKSGSTFVLGDDVSGEKYPKKINIDTEGNYKVIEEAPEEPLDVEFTGSASGEIGKTFIYKNTTKGADKLYNDWGVGYVSKTKKSWERPKIIIENPSTESKGGSNFQFVPRHPGEYEVSLFSRSKRIPKKIEQMGAKSETLVVHATREYVLKQLNEYLGAVKNNKLDKKNLLVNRVFAAGQIIKWPTADGKLEKITASQFLDRCVARGEKSLGSAQIQLLAGGFSTSATNGEVDGLVVKLDGKEVIEKPFEVSWETPSKKIFFMGDDIVFTDTSADSAEWERAWKVNVKLEGKNTYEEVGNGIQIQPVYQSGFSKEGSLPGDKADYDIRLVYTNKKTNKQTMKSFKYEMIDARRPKPKLSLSKIDIKIGETITLKNETVENDKRIKEGWKPIYVIKNNKTNKTQNIKADKNQAVSFAVADTYSVFLVYNFPKVNGVAPIKTEPILVTPKKSSDLDDTDAGNEDVEKEKDIDAEMEFRRPNSELKATLLVTEVQVFNKTKNKESLNHHWSIKNVSGKKIKESFPQANNSDDKYDIIFQPKKIGKYQISLTSADPSSKLEPDTETVDFVVRASFSFARQQIGNYWKEANVNTKTARKSAINTNLFSDDIKIIVQKADNKTETITKTQFFEDYITASDDFSVDKSGYETDTNTGKVTKLTVKVEKAKEELSLDVPKKITVGQKAFFRIVDKYNTTKTSDTKTSIVIFKEGKEEGEESELVKHSTDTSFNHTFTESGTYRIRLFDKNNGDTNHVETVSFEVSEKKEQRKSEITPKIQNIPKFDQTKLDSHLIGSNNITTDVSDNWTVMQTAFRGKDTTYKSLKSGRLFGKGSNFDNDPYDVYYNSKPDEKIKFGKLNNDEFYLNKSNSEKLNCIEVESVSTWAFFINYVFDQKTKKLYTNVNSSEAAPEIKGNNGETYYIVGRNHLKIESRNKPNSPFHAEKEENYRNIFGPNFEVSEFNSVMNILNKHFIDYSKKSPGSANVLGLVKNRIYKSKLIELGKSFSGQLRTDFNRVVEAHGPVSEFLENGASLSRDSYKEEIIFFTLHRDPDGKPGKIAYENILKLQKQIKEKNISCDQNDYIYYSELGLNGLTWSAFQPVMNDNAINSSKLAELTKLNEDLYSHMKMHVDERQPRINSMDTMVRVGVEYQDKKVIKARFNLLMNGRDPDKDLNDKEKKSYDELKADFPWLVEEAKNPKAEKIKQLKIEQNILRQQRDELKGLRSYWEKASHKQDKEVQFDLCVAYFNKTLGNDQIRNGLGLNIAKQEKGNVPPANWDQLNLKRTETAIKSHRVGLTKRITHFESEIKKSKAALQALDSNKSKPGLTGTVGSVEFSAYEPKHDRLRKSEIEGTIEHKKKIEFWASTLNLADVKKVLAQRKNAQANHYASDVAKDATSKITRELASSRIWNKEVTTSRSGKNNENFIIDISHEEQPALSYVDGIIAAYAHGITIYNSLNDNDPNNILCALDLTIERPTNSKYTEESLKRLITAKYKEAFADKKIQLEINSVKFQNGSALKINPSLTINNLFLQDYKKEQNRKKERSIEIKALEARLKELGQN